jgi:hypothetical protein
VAVGGVYVTLLVQANTAPATATAQAAEPRVFFLSTARNLVHLADYWQRAFPEPAMRT